MSTGAVACSVRSVLFLGVCHWCATGWRGLFRASSLFPHFWRACRRWETQRRSPSCMEMPFLGSVPHDPPGRLCGAPVSRPAVGCAGASGQHSLTEPPPQILCDVSTRNPAHRSRRPTQVVSLPQHCVFPADVAAGEDGTSRACRCHQLPPLRR